ncbi:MAG: hypothetical protein PHE10_04435, partial [Kiritimatiellae bacterium]|nr:hypothetical protein [Kiritimatiellia bacterium]
PSIPTGIIRAYKVDVDISVIPEDPGVSGIIMTIAIMIWNKNERRTEGSSPSPIRITDATTGENHQVSASLKGYKTVEQYYRVKAGETRKIDLLLEKEEKRSLFGF